MTESEIKQEGFNALVRKLGLVDAEKFISLILREPFDYTAWRADKFEDLPVEELSAQAMKLRHQES